MLGKATNLVCIECIYIIQRTIRTPLRCVPLRCVSVHERSWSYLRRPVLLSLSTFYPYVTTPIMKVIAPAFMAALWGSMSVLAAPVDPPAHTTDISEVSLFLIYTQRSY